MFKILTSVKELFSFLVIIAIFYVASDHDHLCFKPTVQILRGIKEKNTLEHNNDKR